MPPPALLGSLAIRETGLGGESNSAGAQGSSLAAQQVAGSSALRSHGPDPAMEDGKCGPYVLGEGLPPLPARLVNRVWRGEFVDMADLLQDNLEAERRRGRDDGEPSGRASRPTRREVPDMLSWAQCFCTYVVVVAEKQSGRVRQLLAYQATMLREASRCGGQGWRAYDAMFRQLAVAEPSTDWSRLNPSLYATTFLAQQVKGGKLCHLCMGSDHTTEECALGPLQLRMTKSRPQVVEKGERQGGGVGTAAQARDLRIRQRSDQICYAWNEGRCRFPLCRYRHSCLRCRGEHPALNCAVAPPQRSLPPRGGVPWPHRFPDSGPGGGARPNQGP